VFFQFDPHLISYIPQMRLELLRTRLLNLMTFLTEPVQHREVGGHESEAFLALFSQFGGLRIMEGGAESGFKKVKPESWRPRLLKVKGRKFPRVTEVPLDRSSLNSGDVFIRDAGSVLYQWSGKESSATERGRGSQLTRCISSERNSRAKVQVEDQGKESDAFWAALPGGKGPIAPACVGGVDDAPEDLGSGADSKTISRWERRRCLFLFLFFS
jgi:hypothetical protein